MSFLYIRNRMKENNKITERGSPLPVLSLFLMSRQTSCVLCFTLLLSSSHPRVSLSPFLSFPLLQPSFLLSQLPLYLLDPFPCPLIHQSVLLTSSLCCENLLWNVKGNLHSSHQLPFPLLWFKWRDQSSGGRIWPRLLHTYCGRKTRGWQTRWSLVSVRKR